MGHVFCNIFFLSNICSANEWLLQHSIHCTRTEEENDRTGISNYE